MVMLFPSWSVKTRSCRAKPASPALVTRKVKTPTVPSLVTGVVVAAATMAPSGPWGLVAEKVPRKTSPTWALSQERTLWSNARVYCAAHSPGLPPPAPGAPAAG